MNFTTRKRPRKNAWKDLQSELDEREKLEEQNSVKLKKLDKLKARVCIDDEPSPEARHAFMDFEIGRRMGRDPLLTKGRLIVELFDDLMPRTVDTFVEMLKSEHEPTYRGSQVSKIFPGFHCLAGDRDIRMEGVSSHQRENAFRSVESEANWQVPHLNPGVLSLADLRSSRFNITFRKAEELDGWHAVFGKVVYGFDLLKVISEQGNPNGEPKQPVIITEGGVIPSGYNKKVMRYSSTYRHTGLIGH